MYSFVFFALVPLLVQGANDWSKPCLTGACEYDTGDGVKAALSNIQINGPETAVSDLTSAAGWKIIDCDANSTEAQDIRLVCTGDEASCAHVHKGDTVNTVVRLPEECSGGPFARIASWSVAKDQSLPAGIQRRGAQQVQSARIDFDFAKIPHDRTISLNVIGASAPPAKTKRSLIARQDDGSFDDSSFDDSSSGFDDSSSQDTGFDDSGSQDGGFDAPPEDDSSAGVDTGAGAQTDGGFQGGFSDSGVDSTPEDSSDTFDPEASDPNATSNSIDDGSSNVDNSDADPDTSGQTQDDSNVNDVDSENQNSNDVDPTADDNSSDVDPNATANASNVDDSTNDDANANSNSATADDDSNSSNLADPNADSQAANSTASSGFGPFSKTLSQNLPPINVNKQISLFSTKANCPIPGGKASVNGGLDVSVNMKLASTASVNFKIAGSIVPPAINTLSLGSNINLDMGATVDVKASLTGSFDSGEKSLFSTGLPGLSIPGILTVGPEFSINGQVTGTLGASADLSIPVEKSFPNINLVFPPSQGASSSATPTGSSLGGNPLKVSVGVSGTAAADVTAHLIPRIDFGLDVVSGFAKATIFMKADTSATLGGKATLTASTAANGAPSANGCVDLGLGIDISAGAQGAIPGIFDESKDFSIFKKDANIFEKCFSKKRDAMHIAMSMARLSRRALTCSVTSTSPVTNLINSAVGK